MTQKWNGNDCYFDYRIKLNLSNIKKNPHWANVIECQSYKVEFNKEALKIALNTVKTIIFISFIQFWNDF